MSTPTIEQPPAGPGNGRLADGPTPPDGPRGRRSAWGAGRAMLVAVALGAALLGAGAVTGLLARHGCARRLDEVHERRRAGRRVGRVDRDGRPERPRAVRELLGRRGRHHRQRRELRRRSGRWPVRPVRAIPDDGGRQRFGHRRPGAHPHRGARRPGRLVDQGQLPGRDHEDGPGPGVGPVDGHRPPEGRPSGLTLHPLALGSSKALSVGDALAVIGDPFQYSRSLSTGVVSGLDRTIGATNGFSIAHAIQTDASLNPGNSGGPVLDAQRPARRHRRPDRHRRVELPELQRRRLRRAHRPRQVRALPARAAAPRSGTPFSASRRATRPTARARWSDRSRAAAPPRRPACATATSSRRSTALRFTARTTWSRRSPRTGRATA